MEYINGRELLPDNLLAEIQNYIDGGYIYIPRKECNILPWGSTSHSRELISQRNQEIYEKYLHGSSVKILAEKYYLAEKTIYKIIAKKRA